MFLFDFKPLMLFCHVSIWNLSRCSICCSRGMPDPITRNSRAHGWDLTVKSGCWTLMAERTSARWLCGLQLECCTLWNEGKEIFIVFVLSLSKRKKMVTCPETSACNFEFNSMCWTPCRLTASAQDQKVCLTIIRSLLLGNMKLRCDSNTSYSSQSC